MNVTVQSRENPIPIIGDHEIEIARLEEEVKQWRDAFECASEALHKAWTIDAEHARIEVMAAGIPKKEDSPAFYVALGIIAALAFFAGYVAALIFAC